MPISLLNVPICTQCMQRSWWPEAGAIIVTGPYCVPSKKKHITNHLDHHEILTPPNYGFRSIHSCETELLLTVQDLMTYRDQKSLIDIAILNFSKVLDTVSHDHLLGKLGEKCSWAFKQKVGAHISRIILPTQSVFTPLVIIVDKIFEWMVLLHVYFSKFLLADETLQNNQRWLPYCFHYQMAYAYVLNTDLLSIERADWQKLHDMFKACDANVWQREFTVGFSVQLSALNSIFINFFMMLLLV